MEPKTDQAEAKPDTKDEPRSQRLKLNLKQRPDINLNPRHRPI